MIGGGKVIKVASINVAIRNGMQSEMDLFRLDLQHGISAIEKPLNNGKLRDIK
jgi:hypothetical protein